MAAKAVKAKTAVKEKVGISSPWVTFYRMIEAMFSKDPEIKIEFDEDEPEVKLYVSNREKAEALAELLPVEKKFGNVTLKVTVLIPNEETETPKAVLLQKAFEGNPILDFIQIAGEEFFANPIVYVVFRNEVVQYFNDNLADIHGVNSTLYQDIAAEIFDNDEGIYYCTNVPESVGKPLGEWP